MITFLEEANRIKDELITIRKDASYTDKLNNGDIVEVFWS